MTDDPTRLLDEGGSALLQTLLLAGRKEQPERASMRRTLLAVGVGSALTSTSAAASAGASLGTAPLAAVKGASMPLALVVTKWLGIGLMAGLVASVTALRISAPKAAPQSLSVAVPKPTALRPKPVSATEAAPVPEGGVAAVATPKANRVMSAVPANAVPANAVPANAVPASVQLSAEVQTVDRMRRAIGAGGGGRALVLLRDYEARFPGGHLAPEALGLALQACDAAGDLTNAQALARRILSEFPTSPSALRARAVLGVK